MRETMIKDNSFEKNILFSADEREAQGAGEGG